MSDEQLLAIAREMASAGRPFVLATVDEADVPQVRWMGACALEEPLTFWMAAGATSPKMDQIRGNPAAQVMFNDESFGRVCTITGVCEVVDDMDRKRRLWETMPALAHYLSGPDDPKFGLLKFVARRVAVLDMKQGMEPKTTEL